jgi:galactitol 2-dehydrogenase
MTLDGKTALITGAARGIGLAFARGFIAEGATVALADINADAVAAAAKTLGPMAHAVQMDVTSQASIDAGMADAVAKWANWIFW